MLISNSLVYAELSRVYSCIVHKKVTYDFLLQSSEFLTESTIPQRDRIYISDLHNFEEYPKSFSCQTLITIGTPDKWLISRCECVIELPVSASVLEVMNIANRTFEYYGSWDRALSGVIFRQGSVKELLNISAGVFGNAIGIHNSLLECVAESDYGDSDADQESFARRRSFEYMKAIMEDTEFQSSFRTKGAFFMDAYSVSGCTLAQNLFINDEFAYRIVITERNRHIEPQDMYLLEHLAEYIKLLLTSISGWQGDERPAFWRYIASMIDGGIQDDREIEQRMQARGWLNGDYYVCVVFVIASIDFFGSTATAICSHLKKLIPNSEVFIHNKRIVAFSNLGDRPTDAEEIVHLYLEYMRDMNMKSGVSNVCQGYQCFEDIYKQAEIAIRIGGKLWSHQWIQRFGSVAPYYIMEQSTKDMRMPAFCAPEIMGILKHDHENSTEYFLTLKKYLESNLNLAVTARQLFIHRTTLLYRLSKINQLFPLDLDNPLKRIYYLFSILLISTC